MTTPNPIPTQPETLEPCPWCKALPFLENSLDPKWAHIKHGEYCVMALNEFGRGRTQYIEVRFIPAWNRRAAVTAPRVDRALYSELIHIAAELARGTDFLSTCAEDMNPRLKRADILKTAERQELQLKDWANRVRQAADQLSAATSSPTPAESVDKERQRCAAIARAWLWGSVTDPGVLESVGKYAAQRCQGILRAILSGADVSHLAGTEARDDAAPAERTRVEGEQE